MSDDSKARRKALIDEYKRTPKTVGVYVIRNTRNGKCYVGASRDVRARLNRHQRDLKANGERVLALQEDWNRYGGDAFEFETVDTLEPLDRQDYDPGADLEVLEQLWLEKLEPYDARGYNRRRRGD
ncbi:MAG: GIY-YIG nuclease family protein [Pseudomonadales bacterium]